MHREKEARKGRRKDDTSEDEGLDDDDDDDGAAAAHIGDDPFFKHDDAAFDDPFFTVSDAHSPLLWMTKCAPHATCHHGKCQLCVSLAISH